jgi:hypothetical protein
MDLEQIDVELRNPSVSVRLDGDTAKTLHQLARKRGERVSEVLREAVVAWVASGAAEAEPVYRATYLNKIVAVSSHSVRIEELGQQQRPFESGLPEETWRTSSAAAQPLLRTA